MTQLERCELLHRVEGYDFPTALNYYMDGGERAYLHRGPDFLMMGEHLNFDENGKWRPHWFIWYLSKSDSKSLGTLLRYFPYLLPEVAFRRSVGKKGLQYYKMDRLLAKWEEENYQHKDRSKCRRRQ